MDNLFFMSFSELSQAVGGRLCTGGEQQSPQAPVGAGEGFSSVCIDSRAAAAGGLFVALRGAELDGHRFVQAAFQKGAAGALVDSRALEDSKLDLVALAKSQNRTLVVVDNTLKAFQKAAPAYLERFPKLTRIGITGSSGKTTTKEIAAAIIRQEKQVVMNEGNLNSETGLPLSIFNIRGHHEIGVFEAAMNHPGEMADLAKILNPHIALITNIGSAHIGLLGSRDAIAHEKKQLFSEFSGNNIAYIPAEDEYREFLAKDVRGRKVFYGAASLPGLWGIRDLGLEGSEIDWDGQKVRFPLPGRFNLANALAGIALGLEVGVSSASICRGLESVKALFGRGEIFYGRSTMIRDCYNSNPESATAAVEFCDSLEWKGRRVYIMGSMLELGDTEEKSHAALGAQLSSCKADKVFLFGGEMNPAADVMRNQGKKPFFHTTDIGELSRALDSYIAKGDLVLLKGSRGCALEELTDILTKERGA